jgi:hypothetical protein
MGTLTDRYVWALLRSIPDARRADIEEQLRESIASAIAAKETAGVAAAKAELDTIAELGDPDRRAADYVGRVSHLIGPAYFFDYRRLLTILLAVVTPSVFGALMLAQLIAGIDPLTAAGTAFSVAVSVAVQVCFWTTIAFAVIERTAKGRPAKFATWKPESLTQVPTAERIGIGSTIAGVLAYLLFIGLILWQQNIWVVKTAGGEPIAVLDPRLWSFWLPWFIGVAVLEILFVAVSFAVGHWTWALAWSNVALNLLFAVPAVWLFATDQVFNQPFLDSLPLPTTVVGTVSTVFQFVIVVVAALDVFDGFRRAWRNGRAAPPAS